MIAWSPALRQASITAWIAAMPVEKQVVSLFAGTRGHLDGIAVEDVAAFEEGLLAHVEGSHPGIMAQITNEGSVDEDALEAAVSEFAASFEGSAGPGGIQVDPEAQADAETTVVDSDVTLPEEDIARPDTED